MHVSSEAIFKEPTSESAPRSRQLRAALHGTRLQPPRPQLFLPQCRASIPAPRQAPSAVPSWHGRAPCGRVMACKEVSRVREGEVRGAAGLTQRRGVWRHRGLCQPVARPAPGTRSTCLLQTPACPQAGRALQKRYRKWAEKGKGSTVPCKVVLCLCQAPGPALWASAAS